MCVTREIDYVAEIVEFELENSSLCAHVDKRIDSGIDKSIDIFIF